MAAGVLGFDGKGGSVEFEEAANVAPLARSPAATTPPVLRKARRPEELVGGFIELDLTKG